MNPVEPTKFNELVKKSDHGHVYHLYQWGTLLEEVHGHRLVYLQEDEGIFPLAHIKTRIFGDRLISLPFADYGGPCAQDGETADSIISECEKVAQELGVDFIEIRCPDSRYFEIFNKHGFVRRDDYFTFILELNKDVDDLWGAVPKNKKKKVKSAENRGVQVIQATDKADVKIFYTLYSKTMKKLGSPPQHNRFFEKIWDLFYPKNMRLFLAVYENHYIAGRIVFLHNGTIQQAYSCSPRRDIKVSPNDLLQWHIIKWGKEHGFNIINFGRTRENEGVMVFKSQWSTKRINMPYFYKFYGKGLGQRQETKYKWISQLWSKYMPEFVANRIGPWIIKQVG
ncbi:GNAT family N-acetyltransferase [Dehalococcoidia bacterium]|nr:GNAT family N-acetyltransferase [Dehalococcoidia bacterium]